MFQTIDYIGGSSPHSSKKLTAEDRESIRNLRMDSRRVQETSIYHHHAL